MQDGNEAIVMCGSNVGRVYGKGPRDGGRRISVRLTSSASSAGGTSHTAIPVCWNQSLATGSVLACIYSPIIRYKQETRRLMLVDI